jgi:uncharacterized protein YggE
MRSARIVTTLTVSFLFGALSLAAEEKKSAPTTLSVPAEVQTESAPTPPPVTPPPSRSASVAAAPAALGGLVTVIGLGEVQVSPDIVSLAVEVVNTHKSPVSASADTRKAVNAVLAAARKTVPNPNDLQTTRISINPEYEWTEGKRKFRGYVASQTIEITLRELPRLDSLLEHLNKSPFTTLGNLEFRHSKADSLKREARVLAIRNAAVNAKSLCAAAGRACDELVGARADGAMSGGPGPVNMEFKGARMMAADAGSAMPVLPGQLKFSASVEADYRLK